MSHSSMHFERIGYRMARQVATVKPREETSAPAEATGGIAFERLVESGMLVTEDEQAMRVGLLAGKIEQFAQQRIAARFDANARADIMRDVQTYISKGALGLEITPAEEEAFTRSNALNAWISAQESHARLLRERLPEHSLSVLRAYDLDNAGWPP